ncbi:MAG TPA: glycosyltransferase family 4 protein [Gaiellaceae bacterium]|nr:glycosyltransferase family 4 protein [Gaiellaceae bacterium]
MKILHLVDDLDAIGGVQAYLALLLPELERRGHENVFDGDFDVCFAHTPLVDEVRAAAERGPVVAYAHDYFMVCPGNQRYLERREAFCEEGTSFRCFYRAYTERSTNRRPDRFVRAYRRARGWEAMWPHLHRILAASPFVADVLVRSGAPADRVRVVGYPVAAAQPGPTEEGYYVLYVGRLVAAKGVHVLLRALAHLDGVRALVAGDGPARGGLEREAARLGVNVDFVGWIDAERRARLLRGSRVFVLPSLWEEPFGIAGVEALAAGLPVVASDAGGIPSWLKDGDGGVLVRRGDSVALARAIGRVLDDSELAAGLASAGPAAAARFSLDRHLELLLPELVAK